MRPSKGAESFACPHCGADVIVGARSCRTCGSDSETGWTEDRGSWGAEDAVGYGEDDDFDYDRFVAEEFPHQADRTFGPMLKRRALQILIAIVCLALLWSMTGL